MYIVTVYIIILDNLHNNCCKLYEDQVQRMNDKTCEFFFCLLSASAKVTIITMASRVKLPQGRSLSSLFSCCFKGNDQPEITYCHDNTAVALEPKLPMPPPQELDSMFSELVVSTHVYDPLLNNQQHSSDLHSDLG